MSRIAIIVAAVAAVSALAVSAVPARADMSACESAYAAKDPQKQIELYTVCLKHGGLVGTDVAGAFTNRGVAYEQIGDLDKALADFTAAIQYDPTWPNAYINRAFIEARRGQCAEAHADMNAVIKRSPHRQPFLDDRDRIAASCPVTPKPPS